MRSRQRGATALGMLTIVAILGLAVFALIRLVPLYLEYIAVARALDQTAKESAGSPEALRSSLIRRWTVEDIKTIKAQDVEIKRGPGGAYTMRAWYRAEAPFISNVSLVVDFDKTVTVGGAARMPGT